MMKDSVNGIDSCPHCGSYADRFCTNEADGLGMMAFGIVCNGCPATVTLYTKGRKYPDAADWERAKAFWNKRAE